MAASILQKAEAMKAKSEAAAAHYRDLSEKADAEAKVWETVIQRLDMLQASEARQRDLPIENGQLPELVVENRPKLQSDSLAAAAVKMIKAKGPQTLKAIAAELRHQGKTGDSKKLTATVYSGIWRRQDIFERRSDGLIGLKVEDVEFVD